jgi:hypothetical protein
MTEVIQARLLDYIACMTTRHEHHHRLLEYLAIRLSLPHSFPLPAEQEPCLGFVPTPFPLFIPDEEPEYLLPQQESTAAIYMRQVQ